MGYLQMCGLSGEHSHMLSCVGMMVQALADACLS